MKTENATITFPNRSLAKLFAKNWSIKTLTGHTISHTEKSGETKVKVYNVTKDLKDWIDSEISLINFCKP